MIEWFNPIMFEIPAIGSFGPIKAYWYGFMYALSFLIGYFYLSYSKRTKRLGFTLVQRDNLVLFLMLGIILGGRIGYIILYNFSYYSQNFWEIFAVWKGGMSFHGGLIGSGIAIFVYGKKYTFKFLDIGDIVTSIAPIGLFFAKIGNFINGELYGRVANSICLHFPRDPGNCRYPSQLLEAFLEGILLFFLLWLIDKKYPHTGFTTAFFLIFYGIFRIFIEFFREPDPQLGFLFGFVTMGQILSTLMLVAGIILFFSLQKKRSAS